MTTFAERYPALVQAAKNYTPPEGVRIGYGTAGFRTKANLLPAAVFRSGVIAALRSQYQGGKAIGVMLTASHNPVEDNGLKICDPLGDMLESSWEVYAAKIANAKLEDLFALYDTVVTECKIDTSIKPVVFHAMDTRPSGAELTACLTSALDAMGVDRKDYGLLSTPQLHHMVRSYNTGENMHTEEGYFKKLAQAYREVVGSRRSDGPVVIDAANGVGAAKAIALNAALGDALEIITVKGGENGGVLNQGCGADYVKVGQHAPEGLEMKPNARHGSLDGDADRLVYYFKDDSNKFHLLDGDKIASLFVSFIKEKLAVVGISDIAVGCVQTAYANGSSTKYLTEGLQCEVAFTPTGVKHLHHRALEFDVGVYFEANGHGTVVFGDNWAKRLQQVDAASLPSDEARESLTQLGALDRLINQAVGDALSDALFVEAILVCKGWKVSDWSALYTELPNRLEKVTVSDRLSFQTTDADRTLVKPDGLQDKIKELVSQYTQGRSFVRPSGTEDVVRVYAEAATQREADELSYKVATTVFDEYGGVGTRPSKRE